jgi:peptide-methionine (S)-S-oxide reductase
MAAIFVESDQQRELAEKSREGVAARTEGEIHTKILPLKRFHRAEDYHQKYYLRQHMTLLREFKGIYPDPQDFTDSTATARVNGYLGGHVAIDKVRRTVGDLGLSPTGQRQLLDAAER